MSVTKPQAPITYARALALAWPASVAAAATPLLGVIDAWALGRSARPLDIGAVGLAAAIFSTLYWTCGFLRMGTAGLTAQATGRGDEGEARAVLARAAVLGLGLGCLFALVQAPVSAAAFRLMGAGSQASADTMAAAREYFAIRIWAAPAALLTYGLVGWLMARGRTGVVMATSLLATGLNAALDYWFVVVLQSGAQGVALGTAIAETAAALLAVAGVALELAREGGVRAHWRKALILNPVGIKRMLTINRDIFVRTILLTVSFAWFVQRSATFGDVTLSANQVLLQLMLTTGLALDGAAIAAETLAGQAIGAGDRARYRAAVFKTSVLAGVAASAFALVYALAGDGIVAGLVESEAIRAAAHELAPWLAVSPLIVATCFQLDGVFVGAARAREMRDSMIVSAAVYFPLSLALTHWFGAHGLWAAFMVYFLLRAATLMRVLPRIGADIAAAKPLREGSAA